MVNCIRNIEKAISGNGIKEAIRSEKKNINIARKSIHLSQTLKSDLYYRKRYYSTSSWRWNMCHEWENVLVKTVNTEFKKLTKLSWNDIL